MSNKKILVVDDDVDMLRLLDARLKANGYEVAFAQDGVSCMSEARKRRPDLIILDLGLPAGDGFTTLERIRGMLPLSNTPVIVLTGQKASAAKRRAMAAGASAFFEKSADQEQLLTAIWRFLDDGAANPSA